MFKCYRVTHGHYKEAPKGYYGIKTEPTGLCSGIAIFCSKEHPTFDEIVDCLSKSIFKADYLGCYSFIYWEYYKDFYEWIKQSFEDKNTSNIKIIKRFYKKALARWIKFVEYSDDTFHPQNEYFRMMGIEIDNHMKIRVGKIVDPYKR